MSSKLNNVIASIKAIDDKIARLEHRKKELEVLKQSYVLKGSPVKGQGQSSVSGPQVTLSASGTSSITGGGTTHQREEHSGSKTDGEEARLIATFIEFMKDQKNKGVTYDGFFNDLPLSYLKAQQRFGWSDKLCKGWWETC